MLQHIPFNGDSHIGPEIRKLIKKFRIQTIIETGTWSGHTTREFARMNVKVWSIDATWDHLFEEFGPGIVHTMATSLGIKLVLGDSAKDLPWMIRNVTTPLLFYLDAHGGGANNSNVNPLEAELGHIGDAQNSVIVIHDFFVPGKDYGHNWGGWGPNGEARPLSYDVIKPWIENIYPDGYGYHYNELADGACRGVIYIYPKGKS